MNNDNELDKQLRSEMKWLIVGFLLIFIVYTIAINISLYFFGFLIYFPIILMVFNAYLRKFVSAPSLSKPPGVRMIMIVDFLYSPKTVEQTFNPLVADWRYEYFEALKQGRIWKARWISLRYRYSFIMAMSLSKVFSLLKQIRSVSK